MEITVTTQHSTRTFRFTTVDAMRRAVQRTIAALRRARIEAQIDAVVVHDEHQTIGHTWTSANGWICNAQ